MLKVLNDFTAEEQARKTEITASNFDTVFLHWRRMIPGHINTQTCAQAFFEDLQNKGVLHDSHAIIDLPNTSISILKTDYLNFWTKHERPTNIGLIAAKKDRVIDLWSRRTDGEFFTPEFYASLGHQYIANNVRDNPYKDYAWWDMCCGTGNLTRDCPESMYERLYLSTLNQEDIDIVIDTSYAGAVVFQHDFLNTDNTYEFLSKHKNWIFMLNPPYSASPTMRDEHKSGVSDTLVGEHMKNAQMNKAASNLTTQFLWKITKLIQKYDINVSICMYTQASFIMNPSYQAFYKEWCKVFNFVSGFCFHCSEFEGTTGEWPVLFSIWNNFGEAKPVVVDIFESRNVVGIKEFKSAEKPMNKWVRRPKNIVESVPFTSAITVATPDKTINLTKLPENALGFAVYAANDVMHSKQAYILSAPYANGSGWGITEDNFEQSLVAVASRAIIKGTWLNDKDQFCEPNIQHLEYEKFKNDIIIWLLFGNFNHSAGLDVMYDGKSHNIVNHFSWRSPSFTQQWMQSHSFGQEAQDLIDYCNTLVAVLEQYKDGASPQYQLHRPDAGWYQWRKALCGANSPNKTIEDMYKQYKKVHKQLTIALIPQIYALGILPQNNVVLQAKNSKQNRLHKML